GVSAQKEIAYAQRLGMRVLVTDHHTVVEPRPDCPVINPHRKDCPSAFDGLCGVGVVFKLVSALCEDPGEVIARYGDLIALGTVADIVPLVSENRAIVQLGMPLLENTKNIGLRALMKKAGVLGKVGSQSVVYGLAPRINAAGRMGDAGDVVRLLLCEDEAEAEVLAAKIDGYNVQRQQVEQGICRQAVEQYLTNEEIRYAQIGVVSGENWHSGVNGIVASRLCERFNKPFIVFCERGDEAVGSARSVDGFSIYDAVYAQREMLLRYGGHSQAAGMSIAPSLIPEFRRKINEYADAAGRIEPNSLLIDGYLKLEQLNLDLVQQLSVLEPFGRDNPAPLFCLKEVTIKNVRSLKSGEHCLLEVVRGGKSASLLLFGTPQRLLPYRAGDRIDAVVSVSAREYCGNLELSVIIKDIRRSGFDEENYFHGRFAYELFKHTGEYRGERITRNDVALVYRYLRDFPVYTAGESELAHRFAGTLPYLKVLGCIDVLSELRILEQNDGNLIFAGAERKMDLNESPVFCRIGMQEG
ncbi:MAG: hypothetical protein IJC25_01900, partial [Clostridia bacterium]|nr:hypothetical protein [Clostridia bacterium]